MLVNLENNAFRILGLLVNFGGTNSESVWQKNGCNDWQNFRRSV